MKNEYFFFYSWKNVTIKMNDIKEKIINIITNEDTDLNIITGKKIREEIENDFNIDLKDKKNEIKNYIIEIIEEIEKTGELITEYYKKKYPKKLSEKDYKIWNLKMAQKYFNNQKRLKKKLKNANKKRKKANKKRKKEKCKKLPEKLKNVNCNGDFDEKLKNANCFDMYLKW